MGCSAVSMNWDYVTGLFDGEGSVVFSKDGESISLGLQVGLGDSPTLDALEAFLHSEGIVTSVSGRFKKAKVRLANNRVYDRVPILYVHETASVRKMANILLGTSVTKREPLTILLEALDLKRRIKEESSDFIVDHLAEFDELRRQLHDLARKGTRSLKTWRRKVTAKTYHRHPQDQSTKSAASDMLTAEAAKTETMDGKTMQSPSVKALATTSEALSKTLAGSGLGLTSQTK